MARTIPEIKAQIIEQKNLNPNLSGLNSTSNVSIWILWVDIFAFGIWVHEKIFDVHLAVVKAIEKTVTPYTLPWWKKKVLAFQYGDLLVDSDEYSVIDPTKMIIKQAAIVEGINKVTIKIATEDAGTGELIKIADVAKVNAFKAYIHKIKVAGQPMEYVNADADNLKVNVHIYYDALIMTSAGFNIALDDQVNQIEKSIKHYLKSLEFNGALYVSKLTDFLQTIDGVNDIDNVVCSSKIGVSPYTVVNRVYYPFSGYMSLDQLNITFHAGT